PTLLRRARWPSSPPLPTALGRGVKSSSAETCPPSSRRRGPPAEIVKTLNEASVAAITTPAVVARLKDNGADVVAPERRSPEFLQKFVESEIEKWAGPIRAAGLSAD